MSNQGESFFHVLRRAWNEIVECKATDPDLARQGRILAGILVVIMGSALVAFASFVALGSTFSQSSLDLIFAAFLVVVLLDNRRGNVRRSALIMVFFTIVALNGFFVFVSPDVTSRLLSCLLWVFPILIAGSILPWEIVCAVAGICMINVAALHYAFLSHSPIPEGIPMSQRLAQAITALCAAGALGAINRYQTDRYQRELRARNEDLDKANDVLESEVVRRTQDLVAARDLALSASRVKSEILVNMSHELRTPMNAILGNSDILLDSPLDARQRECVDEVQLSGRTLLGLIDDMLEYSDLDMGGMKLDEQVTDIRSLLNSTITSFSAIAKAKSLPIDIEVAADVPPSVIVDGNRWRRILVNLVGNAVKFTERGAVRVSLDSFDLTTDSLRLRCRVQDTGIGIPRDRLEHIFEMFGQVDSSLKRRMTGAGLGLALSKSLVERMGGTLVVASEPGEGSTFTFDVPAKVSKEKPVFKFEPTNPRPANQAPSTSSESRSNSSPCRILLAEDNIINQKVALAMLKKLGYEADLAANGAQAVEATEKERYDVILMDVQMPEMDGLEATRTILARKEATNRPVIIGFTAHILASDKEQCYAAGMVDIVPKPTELNVLKDALLRAISKAA